jgi:hypothetical protein
MVRLLTTAPLRRTPIQAVHTPAPRDLWRTLHDTDPLAVPTQAPQWIDALTATGRYRDVSRLYQLRDGRRAILPLVRRRGFGSPSAALHSFPVSWGYGGLIAPDGVDEILVAAVLDDLTAAPAARIHLRPNPLHAPAWVAAAAGRPFITASPARAHILDLDGGFDRVWHSRFTSAARTYTRRAEKAGVRIETDTAGRLVPVFYELLLRSFERWAAKQHEPRWLAGLRGRHRDPIVKFHAIADRMGARCRISVAWLDDRPAAAILVLRNGANAHYTRGVMDESLAGPSKANILLHKHEIEAACLDGCRYYHLGESGASAGLAQFKTRFGATGYDYAEYWIERLPLHRANRAARTAVKRVIGFRDA